MRALSEQGIREMKRLKGEEGFSLRELAEMFGCAKSTASLHCRDIFYHPLRKYQTEKEARQIPILRRKGIPRIRGRYPSDNPEYRRAHYRNSRHKLYPCSICNTSLIRRKGGVCIKCYRAKQTKEAIARVQQQSAEREEQRKRKVERIMKRFPTPIIEVCPKAPNQRHYWHIDSDNHGVCKYCEAERDFGIKDKEKRFADCYE